MQYFVFFNFIFIIIHFRYIFQMDWSVVAWGKNTCFFHAELGSLVWKTYYDLLTAPKDESSQLLQTVILNTHLEVT